MEGQVIFALFCIGFGGHLCWTAYRYRQARRERAINVMRPPEPRSRENRHAAFGARLATVAGPPVLVFGLYRLAIELELL